MSAISSGLGRGACPRLPRIQPPLDSTLPCRYRTRADAYPENAAACLNARVPESIPESFVLKPDACPRFLLAPYLVRVDRRVPALWYRDRKQFPYDPKRNQPARLQRRRCQLLSALSSDRRCLV